MTAYVSIDTKLEDHDIVGQVDFLYTYLLSEEELTLLSLKYDFNVVNKATVQEYNAYREMVDEILENMGNGATLVYELTHMLRVVTVHQKYLRTDKSVHHLLKLISIINT